MRATNTVVVDGRKFQHFASLNKQKATDEMKKWFSDFVAYSIPTNDMVRYADMLRVKTMLLYLTAWRMDSRKSWDLPGRDPKKSRNLIAVFGDMGNER